MARAISERTNAMAPMTTLTSPPDPAAGATCGETVNPEAGAAGFMVEIEDWGVFFWS